MGQEAVSLLRRAGRRGASSTRGWGRAEGAVIMEKEIIDNSALINSLDFQVGPPHFTLLKGMWGLMQGPSLTSHQDAGVWVSNKSRCEHLYPIQRATLPEDQGV